MIETGIAKHNAAANSPRIDPRQPDLFPRLAIMITLSVPELGTFFDSPIIASSQADVNSLYKASY